MLTGLLYAMRGEIKSLLTPEAQPERVAAGVAFYRIRENVVACCGGVGKVNAAMATQLFILFRLRPAWLLTAFNAVLSALALFDPFQDIVGGMFSIPAIVYYLSVIGLFLFLTGQALERRRWN